MNSKPKHIDQNAWDAVDSPELTDDELARMKPAREVLKPALFEKLTKGRGPQKKPTKEPVYLRLDRDLVQHYRAMGPGWQTKINRALRETVKERAHTVVGSDKRLPKSTSSGMFASKVAAKAASTITGKKMAASTKTAAKSTSRSRSRMSVGQATKPRGKK